MGLTGILYMYSQYAQLLATCMILVIQVASSYARGQSQNGQILLKMKILLIHCVFVLLEHFGRGRLQKCRLAHFCLQKCRFALSVCKIVGSLVLLYLLYQQTTGQEIGLQLRESLAPTGTRSYGYSLLREDCRTGSVQYRQYPVRTVRSRSTLPVQCNLTIPGTY